MKSLQLTKPHLLLVTGIPGSGKTTFAERFAKMFGAPCVQYDSLLPHAKSPADAQYILSAQTAELVKTHLTIVIDGGADTKPERLALTRLARAAGYEVLLIWVQTDLATAKFRALRPAKTQHAAPLSPDEYDEQFRRFAVPGPGDKTVVISGKHTYATQAKAVLKRLAELRRAHETPPSRPLTAPRRNITVD